MKTASTILLVLAVSGWVLFWAYYNDKHYTVVRLPDGKIASQKNTVIEYNTNIDGVDFFIFRVGAQRYVYAVHGPKADLMLLSDDSKPETDFKPKEKK